MRSSYPAQSDKIEGLLDEVKGFFKAKGFFVSIERNDSQVVVSVKTSESSGRKIMDVSLAGDTSGSLMVTFESFDGSPIVRNSVLLSLLGGGLLTLRRLKMSEIMEGLEREFWQMVDTFMVSS
jgi:hypothetical protein